MSKVVDAPKAVRTKISPNTVKEAKAMVPMPDPDDEEDEEDEEAEPRQAMTVKRPAGGVVGDFDSSDYEMPRLIVVQRTSDKAELFSPGTILLNEDIVLSTGKTPVPLVVLFLKKTYMEVIGFEEDTRPRIFATSDEVLAAGGRLDYTTDKKVARFQAVADMIVALRAKPDEADTITWSFEIGGDRYALAAMRARGMGYAAAKTVLTTNRQVAGDVSSVQFALTTIPKKTSKGVVHVPVLKAEGRIEAEVRDALLALIQS